MIWSLNAQFKRTGSVGDVLERSPKCTVAIDTVVEAVWQSVLEDPLASTHCHFAKLGIAKTSLLEILKLYLKIFSYKIQMVQILQTQNNY